MDNLLKRIQQIKKAHLEDPLLLDWKEIYGRILDPTRAVSLRILEDKLRHGELQPYSLINDLVDYGMSEKSEDFEKKLLHELKNCQHAKLYGMITSIFIFCIYIYTKCLRACPILYGMYLMAHCRSESFSYYVVSYT